MTEHNMLDIHTLDMRHVCDNYNYVLRDVASGKVAVIDPSEEAGVVAFLDAQGWALDEIWCTHHHWDHTDGNLALQERYGCEIIGNAADAARIRGITKHVNVGDQVSLGETVADILCLSGHTIGHVGYYVAQKNALFCGDALFSMGCGRLFEGTPQQLFESLNRIRMLPDDTMIHCAHEYTIANGRFARKAEPENQAIRDRIEQAKAQRKSGKPTIPVSLASEKNTNPFLRWDSEQIQHMFGTSGTSPAQILGALRAAKDSF